MPWLKGRLSERALVPVGPSAFHDKRVGIDVAILMYQAFGSSDSPHAHLQLLARRARFFADLQAVPIFVFDGEHPPEKREEEAKRRKQRARTTERLAAAEADLAADPADPRLNDAARRLRRQCIRVTPAHLEEARELLRALGWPVLTAPSEAEKHLAALQTEGAIDLAVSEDTDTIASGARLCVREFNRLNDARVPPSERYACQVDLMCLLAELGLSYDGFVNMCLLCGSDFAPKIPQVGPALAYKVALAVDGQGGVREPMALRPDSIGRCLAHLLSGKHPRVDSRMRAEPDFDPSEWGRRYASAKRVLAEHEVPPDSDALRVPEAVGTDPDRLRRFLADRPGLEDLIGPEGGGQPAGRKRPAPLDVSGPPPLSRRPKTV